MAILGYSNSYLLSPGGGFYLRTYDEDELYSKFFISGYYGVWYPTAERQYYYSESDIRTWTHSYSSLTSTFTSVLYPTYLSGVTAESIGSIVNMQYFQPIQLSAGKQNVGSFSSISARPVYNHASAFYKMPQLSAKDINLALHTDHYIPDELYKININPILSLTASKTGTVNKNTFPATWENTHAEKYSYNVYDVQAQFAEGFPSADLGYYGRRMGVFDVNSEGSYLPSAFNVEIRSVWDHRAWTRTAIGDVPFSGLEKFTMSGKIPR